ncbi:MAG: flagellar brake protein [Oscillospiraceae bacterium]|nr:flagellar brake protein [Oscillospiraceae bacterium]
MAKQQSKQEHIEIVADMKVLLEIERLSGASEVQGRVSLGSYVEEVLPDGCFLIKMPIHRGYHYPLPRGKAIQMYLFAKSRMFSLAVQFVERVERDNLMFAKMRRVGNIKADQRRDCYRLQCSLPVMVRRVTDSNDEPPPPILCRMANFSDGGMLFTTNENFAIREKLTLCFDIGTEETVDAEVMRHERADIEAQPLDEGEEIEVHKYKVAVRFLHACQKQKNRFYKYIVEQQREIIRRQSEENALIRTK